MSDSNDTKLPILLTEGAANTPIAQGLERVLNSLAAAIDRGELFPAFLTLGGGIGLGIVITVLRGGSVSLFRGLVKLNSPSEG